MRDDSTDARTRGRVHDDARVIYLLQRLVQGVLVLIGVTAIVFGLTFVSGDPVSVLAPLNICLLYTSPSPRD